MGNSCSIGRVRSLEVDEEKPLYSTVLANSCRYFRLTIPDYTELIPPYTHINVQVRVLHGSLAGVYLSPESRCGSAYSKVISQECFSACCSETCDRVYPTARNEEGGVCVACMDPSRDWSSALPRLHSGGQASSAARAAKVRAVVTADKTYEGDARADGRGHAGFTFALRLMPTPPLFSPQYAVTHSLPRTASVEVVTGGAWMLCIRAQDTDTHVSVTARTIQPFNPMELRRGVPVVDMQ